MIQNYFLKRTVVTSFQKAESSSESEYVYDAGVYVLHMTSSQTAVASALSDRSIVSYDRETMQMKGVIPQAHKKQITDLTMLHDTTAVSSSEDGFVKLFDLRQNSASACCSCSLPKEEALSVSVGYDGALIAVGGNKGKLTFFDVRSSNSCQNVLGQYVDAHTLEVTKVRFMKENDRILASGSEDGLVCIYDTSQPAEESALRSILNVEAPLRNLNFFGPNNGGIVPGIWCLTGNETMSIWHWDAAQRMCDYGGDSIRHTLSSLVNQKCNTFGSIDYLVGCTWREQEQQLSLLAGSSSGNAGIFDVSNDGTFPTMSILSKGHMGCIRSYCWRQETTGLSNIYTGGEDARICEWSLQSPKESVTSSHYYQNHVDKPRVGGGPISRRRKGRHTPKNSTPY